MTPIGVPSTRAARGGSKSVEMMMRWPTGLAAIEPPERRTRSDLRATLEHLHPKMARRCEGGLVIDHVRYPFDLERSPRSGATSVPTMKVGTKGPESNSSQTSAQDAVDGCDERRVGR